MTRLVCSNPVWGLKCQNRFQVELGSASWLVNIIVVPSELISVV